MPVRIDLVHGQTPADELVWLEGGKEFKASHDVRLDAVPATLFDHFLRETNLPEFEVVADHICIIHVMLLLSKYTKEDSLFILY